MRKITEQAVAAFIGGYKFSSSNTVVTVDDDGVVEMLLHGNLIARKEFGVISITNAGWSSNVTKERLNALPGVSIHQKNWVWFLNGKEWDGSWEVVA